LKEAKDTKQVHVLTLPPVSYGFVVLPDAAAPACM